METAETVYNYFLKALDWVLKRRERKELSSDIGVSTVTIGNWIKNVKKASIENQKKVAAAAGYSLSDFLSIGKKLLCEEGSISCAEEPPQPYGTTKIIELVHIDVIKRFSNKELATTINERLVKLEQINPTALNQVLGYIDCKILEEQVAQGKADRRKRSNPDQVPITGDRRKLGG